MAQQVTNYTKFVTQNEKDLYNDLKKTLGNPEMVDYVYDEIIRQRDKGGKDFRSIYGQSQEIDGKCSIFDRNILADLLANSHQRNFDTRLQGNGPIEIVNTDSRDDKLVIFRYLDNDVAYIDSEGNFVGFIGGISTEEVQDKLKNCITETAVNKLLLKKVDKSVLFGNDLKIKPEFIPKIVPDGLEEHLSDKVIHITNEERNKWNAKYDKPEAGIPLADLSEEVLQKIADSINKLLNGRGYIKENYIDFTVVAKKSEMEEKITELSKTFRDEIEAVKERLADNNILVNDNVLANSGNVIRLSHQNILVTEDFELTVNGVEYFIDTDFQLDAQAGTITWTNHDFDLDESMKIMVQYRIKKTQK